MAPVVVLHVLIGGLLTFVIAAVFSLVAIVLVRFEPSWPSCLLLIGALAAFIAISSHSGWDFAGKHRWLQRTGLEALTPVVATLLTLTQLLSFAIPLALLGYCMKAV